MKNKIRPQLISLAAVFVFACALTSTRAQTTAPQPQTQDPNVAQTTQAPNLQEELNLTPDQIQKWRALNLELRQQEIAGKARLVQARRAYAESLEAQNPNEEAIKQRAKELADAQSAMTQLQALRQARTLQILTPEQRIKLKEIRERNQAMRRQQNQQTPGLFGRRQDRLQRNQNGNLAGPRQRKLMRQQQQAKP